MAVAVAGQGVVAFFLGTVDGPLHRPQHGDSGRRAVRAGRRPRPSSFCNSKRLVQAGASVAQLADELGEGLRVSAGWAIGGRGGERASPVRGAARPPTSFAASMNSSMIWWLSVFSTTCAPATRPSLVEFDLHLGHGQFERAVADAAAAKDHGQLVHAARAGRGRGGRRACFVHASRSRQEAIDLLVRQPLAAADGSGMKARCDVRTPSAVTP